MASDQSPKASPSRLETNSKGLPSGGPLSYEKSNINANTAGSNYSGLALFTHDTLVKLQSRAIPKKTQTARLWSYLNDRRLELEGNICERSIRPIAPGRKNFLFMGSIGDGKAAAIAYALIETAKMNSVDPEA